MAESRVRRSAGIVGLAVFGSRILGLVREVVFTTLFGAGRELDAFIAAFRIPNLLRDLFAEGALSAAFVPTFARRLEREGERSAWDLASRIFNDLAILVGAIVCVGLLVTPAIVDAVAPGFRAEPGKTELTIELTRILLPFLWFVALAAVAMGVLNTRGVFGVPASASTFFNLGSIVGGLFFAAWLAPDYLAAVWDRAFGRPTPIPVEQTAPALVGMAIGTLIGGFLQLLVQVPSLVRVGFSWRPLAGFRDPGVREVLRLMGPAALGVAAVQVNVLVNTTFASQLGDGPVSWLGVAFRFMYLPIGMFGVALGTAVLPPISRAAARGDLAELRRLVGQALRLLVVLCVPAAAGLAIAAEPIIALVYEHGRFGADDTRAAATALAAYSVGLTGYAAIKVLGPAFYALGDAATPMRVSLASVAVNLALNWLAVSVLGLGHGGLALTTSIVALTNAGALLMILRARTGALDVGLGGCALRVATATAGMALLCALWVKTLDVAGASLAERAFAVLSTIALGGTSFALLARLAGVAELDEAIGLVTRRLRR
ncbi:MAG: murein biosynthesis integral membrane protein MurJ [Candidatus Binatia bacterium]